MLVYQTEFHLINQYNSIKTMQQAYSIKLNEFKCDYTDYVFRIFPPPTPNTQLYPKPLI